MNRFLTKFNLMGNRIKPGGNPQLTRQTKFITRSVMYNLVLNITS